MDENLHDRIVESALEMFISRGLKSVTMDQIAASISISKRTLYEEFASKTDLVRAVLSNLNTRHLQRNEEIGKMNISVIEKIFMIACERNEHNNETVIFFEDLITTYPSMIQKMISMNYEEIISKTLEVIEEGSREGVFVANINGRIAVEVFYNIKLNRGVSNKNKILTLRNEHTYTTIFFLRSIATQRGIEEINRLCEVNNINIYN